MSWSHFSHEADLGLRGRAANKSGAFEEIARALTAAVTDPSNVNGSDTISLACHAPDDEALLVEWLNALIYEMAVRRMLFSDFSVSIRNGDLSAVVRGESVDRARHEPAVEVKGATYTALSVRLEGNEWVAECVVDV